MGFKVRKWSNTNERPFDVVYEDLQHNNVHYQPGVEFSTEEFAVQHAKSLSNSIENNPERLSFIRDHWPIDGAVTE